MSGVEVEGVVYATIDAPEGNYDNNGQENNGGNSDLNAYSTLGADQSKPQKDGDSYAYAGAAAVAGAGAGAGTVAAYSTVNELQIETAQNEPREERKSRKCCWILCCSIFWVVLLAAVIVFLILFFMFPAMLGMGPNEDSNETVLGGGNGNTEPPPINEWSQVPLVLGVNGCKHTSYTVVCEYDACDGEAPQPNATEIDNRECAWSITWDHDCSGCKDRCDCPEPVQTAETYVCKHQTDQADLIDAQFSGIGQEVTMCGHFEQQQLCPAPQGAPLSDGPKQVPGAGAVCRWVDANYIYRVSNLEITEDNVADGCKTPGSVFLICNMPNGSIRCLSEELDDALDFGTIDSNTKSDGGDTSATLPADFGPIDSNTKIDGGDTSASLPADFSPIDSNTKSDGGDTSATLPTGDVKDTEGPGAPSSQPSVVYTHTSSYIGELTLRNTYFCRFEYLLTSCGQHTRCFVPAELANIVHYDASTPPNENLYLDMPSRPETCVPDFNNVNTLIDVEYYDCLEAREQGLPEDSCGGKTSRPSCTPERCTEDYGFNSKADFPRSWGDPRGKYSCMPPISTGGGGPTKGDPKEEFPVNRVSL